MCPKISYKDKLDQITLVMLTYQRHDLALRSMRYWSNQNIKLIVIDGSNVAIDKSKLQGLSPKITYVHEQKSYYMRLRGSIDLVSTKYAALVCDDEFYIPSAIYQCITELENNLELSSCIGRSLGFYYREGVVFGREDNPSFRNYGVLSDSPNERVLFHMENYVPSLIYGICRADIFKSAFHHITKKEFPVFAILELQFAFILSYTGKSKVIPHLMWLRNQYVKPTRRTDSWLDPSADKGFDKFWENSSSSKLKSEFIDIMVEAIKTVDCKESYRHKAVIVEAFSKHVIIIKNNDLSNLSKNRFFLLTKMLIDRLAPNFLKEIVRSKRHIKRINNFQGSQIIASANSLVDEEVRVDFEALKEIERYEIEFHRH